jgi:hypothetical protein
MAEGNKDQGGNGHPTDEATQKFTNAVLNQRVVRPQGPTLANRRVAQRQVNVGGPQLQANTAPTSQPVTTTSNQPTVSTASPQSTVSTATVQSNVSTTSAQQQVNVGSTDPQPTGKRAQIGRRAAVKQFDPNVMPKPSSTPTSTQPTVPDFAKERKMFEAGWGSVQLGLGVASRADASQPAFKQPVAEFQSALSNLQKVMSEAQQDESKYVDANGALGELKLKLKPVLQLDRELKTRKQFEDQWKAIESDVKVALVAKPRSDEQQQQHAKLTKTHQELDALKSAAEKDPKNYATALLKLKDVQAALPPVLAFDKANQRQESLQKAIVTPLSLVKRNAFPAGEAAAHKGNKNLEAGDEFKKFLSAMAALESKKTLPNIEALENFGNAYLNHAENKTAKDTPHRLAKMKICHDALRNAKYLRLALESESIGLPPWDPEKEAIATKCRAISIFESGGKANQLPPGEAGTSGSWFVEAKTAQLTDKDKAGKSLFIFKPADTEDVYEKGWERNGGAIREVAAKLMSDHVLATTGIDLGVSPTSLVMVDNERLPDRDALASGKAGGIDDDKPPQRVGAIQELAANDGNVQKVFDTTDKNYDPLKAKAFEDDLKQIPPDELGKTVWADFLTINHDRHGGNILIDRANKKLIPIDHGKSMPPTLGVAVLYREEIGQKNALVKLASEGRLPQLDQKLSPEMVRKIDLHDPFATANHVKDTRDKLKDPTKHDPFEVEQAGKLSDEALDLSAKSAYFFKVAAKELTLRQMIQAQSRYMYKVLAAANQKELDQAVAWAIAKAQAASTSENQLIKMFPKLPGEQTQLLAAVTPLGWIWSPTKTGDMFINDPDLVLKIIQNQLVEPSVAARTKAATAKLNQLQAPLPSNLASLSPYDQMVELEKAVAAPGEAAVKSTAALMGLDLDRTNDLKAINDQLEAIDNGPLKDAATKATEKRTAAKKNLDSATDANRSQLQAEFNRLDREWTDAMNAVNNATAPFIKKRDEITTERGEHKEKISNYLELGGDETIKAAGKNPAKMLPQEKFAAIDEALTAEFNKLGGEAELKKAAAYGKVNLQKTPRYKLETLNCWFEFRDNALKDNMIYKVGLAPNPNSGLQTLLGNFKQALAWADLDSNTKTVEGGKGPTPSSSSSQTTTATATTTEAQAKGSQPQGGMPSSSSSDEATKQKGDEKGKAKKVAPEAFNGEGEPLAYERYFNEELTEALDRAESDDNYLASLFEEPELNDPYGTFPAGNFSHVLGRAIREQWAPPGYSEGQLREIADLKVSNLAEWTRRQKDARRWWIGEIRQRVNQAGT